MQYFKELPEVTSSGIGYNSIIELEVEGQVEKLPDDRKQEKIVFLGRMGKTIYLVTGCMVEYEYIKPEESQSGKGFTRLRIGGTCLTVF